MQDADTQPKVKWVDETCNPFGTETDVSNLKNLEFDNGKYNIINTSDTTKSR